MSSPIPRILILDDDPEYGRQMSAYLEANGCAPAIALDPQEFEEQLARFTPDLVLLDQRLGETRGTDVLMRLRQRSAVPCIVVTGLSDPLDRIVNLEVGADDEIEKSAAPRELLARIRAVLRRNQGGAAASSVAGARDRKLSGWTLSVSTRGLLRPDGKNCGLTGSEFETLSLLWDSLGQPVSHMAISERVFKRPHWSGDRAVDTVVMKLRHKITAAGGTQVISSVRLAGYVFTGFPATAEA